MPTEIPSPRDLPIMHAFEIGTFNNFFLNTLTQQEDINLQYKDGPIGDGGSLSSKHVWCQTRTYR